MSSGDGAADAVDREGRHHLSAEREGVPSRSGESRRLEVEHVQGTVVVGEGEWYGRVDRYKPVDTKLEQGMVWGGVG